jgi:hypothetical protein
MADCRCRLRALLLAITNRQSNEFLTNSLPVKAPVT